jgi:hypothetical protein
MRLTEKRAGRQACETRSRENNWPEHDGVVGLTGPKRIIFTTTPIMGWFGRIQTAHACVIGIAMCVRARSKEFNPFTEILSDSRGERLRCA